MGLFSNIREDVLNEFNDYVGDIEHEINYESNNSFSKKRENIINHDDDFIFKLELKRWGYSIICPKCQHEKI